MKKGETAYPRFPTTNSATDGGQDEEDEAQTTAGAQEPPPLEPALGCRGTEVGGRWVEREAEEAGKERVRGGVERDAMGIFTWVWLRRCDRGLREHESWLRGFQMGDMGDMLQQRRGNDVFCARTESVPEPG